MMARLSYERRRAVADALRANRDEVADVATAEFLDRHPAWVARYGDRARRFGVEDARFHMDFLSGAVQSGSESAFVDYARWTARVLGSRGIEVGRLVENLEQVRDGASRALDEEGRAVVASLVAAAIRALESGDDGVVDPHAVTDADADAPLAPEVRLYVQAILGGQRQAALNIALEAVLAGHSVPDVYCDLLQPAQYEVGRLWESNQVTVAQEHMATAITQYVVAQLYGRLPIPESVRGNALVTGVEGELHQLGANMVADMLEAEGWNVRFLGTQLPHRDILHAVEEHGPAVVGISATMLYSLPRVAELVSAIRASAGEGVRIVVGGGAFRAAPDAWADMGADGAASDLRSAVALVARLVATR
jgi:MerR family transcriptional regulator, light-induced transcriptional regulator